MNKTLRYSLIAVLAFISTFSFADAYKTLTFPEGNSQEISAYTETWTATVDNFTWTIKNFNNNKNAWVYIKCGRKNVESVAYIETAKMDKAIGSIVMTVDDMTASKVNSITLTVASDEAFTNVVEKVEAKELAKGDLVFNVTKTGADLYYQFTFDCQAGSKNGLITISKIAYYEAGNEPEIVDISNTPETAYTIAKAHELITAGEGLATNVYVKGYITEITELSTQYGNATYYISDDKTTDNQLYVYRGYYLDGEKFTAEDQLNVGDEVVVYGQLSVYNGSHQITTGSSIYSINGKTSGINAVAADKTADGAIFNLAGQRMEKPVKGINIINGKKVVVK